MIECAAGSARRPSMIGTTISHYRILEKVGSGGMGVVYKARDLELERVVALKFLPPVDAASSDRDRFVREARAASALDHPNVCTIHEIGVTDDGRMFIAMAFYEGESLSSLTKPSRARELPTIHEVVGYALQIADGLAAAHAKGIVHRDIKPANLLLTSTGLIKIVDFGVAKLSGATELTREGATVGTVARMAPEQARGEEVDESADVWSLGTVLYELLAGRPPFGGAGAGEVLAAILTREPDSLAEACPEAPAELVRIVERCLRKNPGERYHDAGELLVDLRSLERRLAGAEGATETLPDARAARHPRRNRRYAVGGIAVAVLASLWATLWVAGREDPGSGQPLPVVVGDVENETGDEALDGLSGMLITALQGSPHLSVLPRSRIFDVLGQLGRTDFERIDEALLREVGLHAGIDLLALPSVSRFGDVYALDVKVVDLRRDTYLVTADTKVEGLEAIPDAIDTLARRLREALAERALETSDMGSDVAQLTTADVEAYRHFFEGEELLERVDTGDAIGELERAVELDPTFGLAWYRLAYGLHLEGHNERARGAIDRAAGLLHRMPERDRYLTRAFAAHLGHSEAELESGLTTLREMERRFPDDKEMLFFIGDWSYHNRHYDTAGRYLERVLEMDPGFERALWHLAMLQRDTGRYHEMLETALRYDSIARTAGSLQVLGVALARLDRYEEAATYLERSREVGDDPFSSWELAFVRFGQGDIDGAEALARTELERHPELPWAHYALAELLLRAGRAEEAKAVGERLREADRFHGSNLVARIEVVGGLDAGNGVRLAEGLLEEQPTRYRDRIRTIFFHPVVEHTLGVGYLESGRPERALPLLEAAVALAPLRSEVRADLERARAAAR